MKGTMPNNPQIPLKIKCTQRVKTFAMDFSAIGADDGSGVDGIITN